MIRNKTLIIFKLKDTGMVNPFSDQRVFMEACDQTTNGIKNEEQYALYRDLIKEEVEELNAAIQENDEVEQLDALIDILVVTIGAIHSMGADAEGAWQEVLKTNLAKIDSSTGKVIKREDGKVLKPQGWEPPNLLPYIKAI